MFEIECKGFDKIRKVIHIYTKYEAGDPLIKKVAKEFDIAKHILIRIQDNKLFNSLFGSTVRLMINHGHYLTNAELYTMILYYVSLIEAGEDWEQFTIIKYAKMFTSLSEVDISRQLIELTKCIIELKELNATLTSTLNI